MAKLTKIPDEMNFILQNIPLKQKNLLFYNKYIT